MLLRIMDWLGLSTLDDASWLSIACIPKDIPLDLPAPFLFMAFLLIVSFMLHIVFVNFMVGASVLVFVYELLGLKKPIHDRFAMIIANTITINKSLAVVLGVAPLLVINTIYTVYFYTANALTGTAWISLIPLIIFAFLTTYLHKYTWHLLDRGFCKIFHISLSAIFTAIFLFIPLIFLANINLMLFPEHWGNVAGFFSAIKFPNVFARYFHFILASIALTGLFLVWHLSGKNADWFADNGNLQKHHLLVSSYHFAFWPTLLQFIAGPIVLFTLPKRALQQTTFGAVLLGSFLAIFALIFMWLEIKNKRGNIGNNWRFYTIVLLIFMILILMIFGRHSYREAAVSEHRKLVKEKTDKYMRKVESAKAQ